MSEDPAPYWVSRPEPLPAPDGQGWSAAVSWRDASRGHELRWRSETTYETWAEALLAACEAEANAALFECLLAAHSRDMRASRQRGSLSLDAARRGPVELDRRPFAEWERAVRRRFEATTHHQR
jgi:hypothetical protein